MTYTPQAPQTIESLADLQSYVEDELTRLASTLNETIAIDLRPVYRAPDKPRAGMIVCADGTSWDPGGGHGVYFYNLSAAWVKLG